ncbi:MAG: ABC transporter permease, partial [Ardenticatenaceae bacterium]
LGLRAVAPVVADFVVVEELDERPMRLLGVDPLAEAPFRSYLTSGAGAGGRDRSGANQPPSRPPRPYPLDQFTAFLTQPDSLLLSQVVAEQAGLTTGDVLTLRIGAREEQATIVGLLEPSDDISRRALDSLLLADVATAQELLEQVGSLTSIDLILPDTEEAVARVEQILPEGVRVERPASRSQTIEELTAAFELNLTALSLLALIVGMFLIYNTVTFSVVQRRPVLGTLRALGVTRGELFALIMAEALLMGLVGALLGAGLGVLLGRGTVRLVTQTINDLYFTVRVAGVHVAPLTLLKGGLIGIGSALLAAAAPAWEASTVEPITALRRSAIESSVVRLLRPLTIGAGALGSA